MLRRAIANARRGGAVRGGPRPTGVPTERGTANLRAPSATLNSLASTITTPGQGARRRAQGAGRRAQGAGRKDTGRTAQDAMRRAQGKGRKAARRNVPTPSKATGPWGGPANLAGNPPPLLRDEARSVSKLLRLSRAQHQQHITCALLASESEAGSSQLSFSNLPSPYFHFLFLLHSLSPTVRGDRSLLTINVKGKGRAVGVGRSNIEDLLMSARSLTVHPTSKTGIKETRSLPVHESPCPILCPFTLPLTPLLPSSLPPSPFSASFSPEPSRAAEPRTVVSCLSLVLLCIQYCCASCCAWLVYNFRACIRTKSPVRVHVMYSSILICRNLS